MSKSPLRDPTWGRDEALPDPVPVPMPGKVLGMVRGVLVGGVTYGSLMVLLLLRLVEAPIFGLHRPLTPWITRFVCRTALLGMGMGFKVTGKPMTHRGALVANHSSWLDVFALNAPQQIYFVSKSEVAGWPGIGWLARATGTVFISRKAGQARDQNKTMRDRLLAGHRLVFFPEGTSSDATRVLPFKSTLFAAFFDTDLADALHIQPVSVIYHAPKHLDPRFYGWWGDMEFAPHLWQVLTAIPQGSVELVFHGEIAVRDFPDRKALAAYCEDQVRAGVMDRLSDAASIDRKSSAEKPAAR